MRSTIHRFQKIVPIGATGSIESIVLEAFEKEPAFTLTLLQRASSKVKLPIHFKTISIADSYPSDELVSAFKGQDVILNCVGT